MDNALRHDTVENLPHPGTTILADAWAAHEWGSTVYTERLNQMHRSLDQHTFQFLCYPASKLAFTFIGIKTH